MVIDIDIFASDPAYRRMVYATLQRFEQEVSDQKDRLDQIDAEINSIDVEVAALTSDHGALDGLTDDDHTQYLLVDGSRELSTHWDSGEYKITAGDFDAVKASGDLDIRAMSSDGNARLTVDASGSGKLPYMYLKQGNTLYGVIYITSANNLRLTATNELELNAGTIVDVLDDMVIGAGKDLDCKTNGGYLKPRRVRQSAIPTPDANELLVWSDSDDDTVHLVYNDDDGGVVSVSLT